ncbi:MAG: prepilin-type N-terminal cleavage/methylation domain-containing protein [Phycisphaerales bacterium]|nr:prepilin-type N-terminal cleavage/methylation domain-containing protein [Phycisphaerales bacterium]
MRHNHRAEGRGSVSPSLRTAFTLIELMVVVGIIGLLVAIVVPAISTARDQARATVTQATIGVLETGLEMYRAETRLDGDYPPSVYTSIALNPFKPRNPHSSNPNSRIQVSGANLLVWGLAGADLLGTPGFRNLDRVPDRYGGWLSDTGQNGLYRIQNGQPAISRSGPFVDVSKIKMSKPQVLNDDSLMFSIPAARNMVAVHEGVVRSYSFLDAFDQPILYYKANPGAPYMVDAGNTLLSHGDYGKYQVDTSDPKTQRYIPTGVYKRYIPTGVYNLLDNAPVTGIVNNAGSSVVQGMDFGAGQVSTAAYHWLANLGAQLSGGAFRYDGIPGSFAHTVRNPNINPQIGMRQAGTGVFRPHNADKFILLSAGKDGIFGTGDDIANFPINKD